MSKKNTFHPTHIFTDADGNRVLVEYRVEEQDIYAYCAQCDYVTKDVTSIVSKRIVRENTGRVLKKYFKYKGRRVYCTEVLPIKSK